jgi:predicted branched-subunit amino acid permease
MSSETERGSGVYLAGARAGLPFALATFVLGISFGVVGNVERLGLDVIFPAFFLALLMEELRAGGRTIAVALIAAVLSLALVPFVPPGVPVNAACAAALLGLRGSSS